MFTRAIALVLHSYRLEDPVDWPFIFSGPVAQRLEQGTHNPLVAGSNPAGPTFKPYSTWLTGAR